MLTSSTFMGRYMETSMGIQMTRMATMTKKKVTVALIAVVVVAIAAVIQVISH